MANDGSVIIDILFNTDKAKKQYQEFGDEAAKQLDKKIGNSKAFTKLTQDSIDFSKKAILGISGLSAAVAGFSIKAAGDMQAMNAQFFQVFGDLESNAQSSIDAISKETNILPNRLKPAFVSMAAFAKTTGMDTADALDLSSRATKAAADSAAFYDKSIGDVSESLQAYLKGNYENDAALGISSTETTRNAAANKLYGKSFNELSEAQKQLTLLQMVEDGNKLSGALGQAAREGGGLENVIGNMKQAITDLAAAFGAPLLDPFLAIVSKLSSAMSALAEKIKQNPALVKVIVGVIGTLVAAFGAVWLKAAGFAKAIKLISTIIPIVASPIFLVVAAIGALVTAFVYFYDTNEKFRATVDGIVTNAKKLLSNIGIVVKMIGAYFTDFSGKFQELRKQLESALGPELAGKVTKTMVKILSPILDMAKGVQAVIKILNGSIKSMDDLGGFLEGSFSAEGEKRIMAISNAIKNFITYMKNLLSPTKAVEKGFDVFGIALKVLKSVVLGMLGPIGLFIKAIELIAKVIGGGDIGRGIDQILQGFSSLASGIKTNGPKIGKSAGEAIKGILTSIASALPGIISGGLQIIAALVSGIAQGLPSIALAASQLIMSLTGAILLLVPQIALSATAIIVAFLGALALGLPQIIVAGANLIGAILQGITEQLPMLIESAASLIVTWLTALTEHIPEIVVAGMNLLIAFLDGITQKLPDLVMKVGELIVAFLTALAGQLPQIVIAGADLLINFLNGLASKMPNIVAAALNLAVQFIDGVASKAGDVIAAGVNLIVQILEGIADSIGDIVSAGMDIVDSAVEGILNAQDRLFNAAVTLINGFAENIRNHSGDVKSAAGNLLSAMLEALPGSGLVSAGYDLIMGMAEGIGNAAGAVVRKAKEVASNIVDGVKGFLGIHSPSRVMRDQVGKFIPEGLAAGIDKGADDALDSMDNLSSKITKSINTDFLKSIPGVQALLDGTLIPELVSKKGTISTSGTGYKGGQIINNTYNNSKDDGLDNVVFEIPVIIEGDGRNWAKATARYTWAEIKKMQSNNDRKRGER